MIGYLLLRNKARDTFVQMLAYRIDTIYSVICFSYSQYISEMDPYHALILFDTAWCSVAVSPQFLKQFIIDGTIVIHSDLG